MNCINFVVPMNPCKCGYYPDRSRCHCTDYDIKRFIGKISKPFWDRLDICVQVNDVGPDRIREREVELEGTSAYMRGKVELARKRQLERFSDMGIYFNSQMDSSQVQRYCVLGREEQEFMNRVYQSFHLTARGYYRILKTARTVADIEENENITVQHLSEALSYRSYQAVIG